MLAVPEPAQYDEEAYSEALTECLEAIKRFIMHTRRAATDTHSLVHSSQVSHAC